MKIIDQITLLVLYLLFIYNRLLFHIFQQWLIKNDCSRTSLVQITFEKLVQLCDYSIGLDFQYALFDYITFKIFCLKTEFLDNIEYMSQARYKAKVPKTAIPNGIASTMEKGFSSKSSRCQSLFVFTVGEHWYSTKLKLTSSLMWSLANSQQLMFEGLIEWPFFVNTTEREEKGRQAFTWRGKNKRSLF